MKKQVLIIIILTAFLLLLILPLTAAAQIELNKQTYQPGETLLAEITGDFIDNIRAEDVYFYSGRIQTPMIYDIGKIQGKYYLYAILPYKERNYSLRIEDAHYFEEAVEKEQDIAKNFSVSGDTISFYVNPGLIITNKDFNIKVKTIKEITVQSDFLEEKQSFDLSAGQTKKFLFSISEVENFTLTDIVFSGDGITYRIPAAIIIEGKEENETEIIETCRLKFSTSSLDLTLLENEDYKFKVKLDNIGQIDLDEIDLMPSENLEDIIEIKPEKIKDLKSGDSKEISLTINSDKTEKINGNIKASGDNCSAKIFLSISTTINESDVDISSSTTTDYKYCAEENGKKCASNETCTGETIPALDGVCCLGECQQKKEELSLKWLWFISIIVVILIIIFFFYKKYKSGKKPSKQLLKEKSEKYEKKFRHGEVKRE